MAMNTTELRDHLQEYRQAYRQIAATFRATLDILTAHDKAEIVKSLGRTISGVFRYIGSSILLRDFISGSLYPDVVDGFPGQTRALLDRALEDGHGEWVLREARGVVLPFDQSVERDPVTAVWAPLVTTEESFGVLVIFLSVDPETLTQHDESLLLLVASQAAVALENAHLVEQSGLRTAALHNVKTYLESVLENMPNGLVASDLEGRITLFNHSASELFSLSPDVAIGSTFQEVFPSDVAHILGTMLTAGVEKGRLEGRELELTVGESTKVPVRVVPSLLREADHKPAGMIYVLTDLRDEMELRELRRLDRLKDQFVSTVSHELRTPITAIKSFAEILLEYDDPDSRKEFLQIINRESDRLARMVNDILDLSKIEAGMMQWQIEDLPIQEAILQAADSVRILAAEKGVRLSLTCGDEPFYVRADRERIVQVIINLLSNAIKFTPEGGEVAVGCERLPGRRASDTQDYAKIWVRDTGVGIPPKYLPLIFERFHQVTNGTNLTDKPKGTGLGLPISKEIVTQMGGNIWAESEPGEGSTFYFTLPLARIREETHESGSLCPRKVPAEVPNAQVVNTV